MSKKKIVSIDLTGFLEVPKYPGYYINKSGEVYSSRTDKMVGCHVNREWETTKEEKRSLSITVVTLQSKYGPRRFDTQRLAWFVFNNKKLARNESLIAKPGFENEPFNIDNYQIENAKKKIDRKIRNGLYVHPFAVQVKAINVKTKEEKTFTSIVSVFREVYGEDINSKLNGIYKNKASEIKFFRIGVYRVLNPYYKHTEKEINWFDGSKELELSKTSKRVSFKYTPPGSDELIPITDLREFCRENDISIWSVNYAFRSSNAIYVTDKDIRILRAPFNSSLDKNLMHNYKRQK